jgi:hypothetical protein
MGKRSRRRGVPPPPTAPQSTYRDPEGNAIVLRGSLSAASRRRYSDTLTGSPLSQEDAWQRAIEFLFERLAVSWEIAGADPIEHQSELLGRYRFASAGERHWIRDVLREHVAEHFPELQAP